ncbi:MAG: HIT family protein [Lachnospiraceae bacterium]|nr:HIT family protein [Lachnospiraceae bacterium]
MKDDNCIFCKLANGDIPTTTLYEDDDFRIIFDASPATVGHALILPKDHVANVFEISDELQAKAYVLAKKAAAALTEVFGADGINILQNNNEAAGQTVFHFHIHLIPRYKGDKAMVSWKPGEQDKAALEAGLAKFKEIIG